MKKLSSAIFFIITASLFGGMLYAQTAGDYRSAQTGNWALATTWETYNGSAWVPAVNPPTGAENIIVKDTVTVSSASITINGYVTAIDNGVLTVGEGGSVTFGATATYEHARNAGTIPMSTWVVGSLAKFTGVTNTAPGNRVQSFSNITWNCPAQTANLNMGWNNVTITGTINIISTGTGRWYFAGPTTGSTAEFTINGNIIQSGGSFATHGTGNGNTVIIVNHYGNITSTAGNFSIARGSQAGTGTTTWNLYGDLSFSTTETQNSNPTGAKFVIKGPEERMLSLTNVLFSGGGFPVTIDSGATVHIGSSLIAGNGAFTVNDYGTLFTSHTDGLNGNLTTTGTITLSTLGSYGFNGTAAQVTGALQPATVRDFAINNPAGVTLTNDLTVNNMMTVGAGALSTGGKTFSYGPSVTLNYKGTAARTTSDIEFPVSNGPVNLWIDNPAGITLHANRSITGTVNIKSGKFNLGANTLTLGPEGLLIETAGNTVTGTTGKVVATRTLNAPNAINVAGLGAMISSAANLGSTTVERYHNVRLGNGNQSILRTYRIMPTNNTGLNAVLRFTYDESELNGIPENTLTGFTSSDGTNNSWSYAGGTLNTNENYLELSGIDSFAYYTLGSSVNQIPVELVSFSAKTVDGKVVLEWATATETDNRGWEVEKKSGNGWQVLGFVAGNGTKNTPSEYTFVDNTKLSGKSVYRIRQIDYSGASSYSNEVEVSAATPSEFALYQNYPNPFNPSTIITFSVPMESHILLTVYNMLGEKIAVLADEIIEAGVHSRSFNANEFPSGIYIYRLTDGSIEITKSMMLVK